MAVRTSSGRPGVPEPEAIAEGVYALGGELPLDGRLSWAPFAARGYQPLSCYLLVSGNSALLVDTGAACHRELVLGQLHQLLPDPVKLAIFLTRAEFDCIGNLGPIVREFPVETLFAGGISNPFDAFDDAARIDDASPAVPTVARRQPGETIQLDDDRLLTVISPALRILATFWAFDQRSGVLFTSDAFGHVVSRQPGARRLATSPVPDRDEIASHLYAKFSWLRSARTRLIVDSLRAVLDTYDIRALAPTHGCIISGGDAARRHLEIATTILAEVHVPT